MNYYTRNTIYTWHPKSALRRLAYSAIYVSFMAVIFQSCDEFVTVEVPKNQLIADGVFEEKATANAAMVDIYSKIRDVGMLTGSQAGLSHTLGLYADEFVFFGSATNGNTAFYNNSLLPASVELRTMWTTTYNQIYGANAIIEGVEGAVKLPQELRDQLKGEALVVRALLHFYLANVFGAVPYVTTTDYQQNLRIAKTPVAGVYNLAVTDLDSAIVLLPETYAGTGRIRPNKFAAYALLSRVQLYAGNWNESSNAASAVLNNTALYPYESDLDKIFLKESTSTIWQLSPRSATGNTVEASTFIFTAGPPALSAMNELLINAFELGDNRRTKWTNAVTNGSVTWYHPFKYKKRTAGTVENSIVFRLGELYLIRAEARARAGELMGAKEDLNKIRNTAGLGNTPAVTQQEILDAVLQERRVELFTEFGHRFFDLKRFNKVDSVLSLAKNGWDTTDALFPLPETEIDLNANLEPQNPGY